MFEHRYYSEVSLSSTANHDYEIPDGATLTLTKMGGNAIWSALVQIRIIYDPGGDDETVLLTTNGESIQEPLVSLVGGKTLRISLVNNSLSSVYFGGFWTGQLYT